MEAKGRFTGASKDWKTGRMNLTFEIEKDVSGDLDALQGKLLRITVKQWHDKRSLDANAYYYALLGKVADSLGVSIPRAHNLVLRDYGQEEYDENGNLVLIAIPDTDEAEDLALESSTFHVRPTDAWIENNETGERFRIYHLLRGSHTYDTKEMSRLINGLVAEAKQMGIETLTPNELQELYDAYEKKYHAKKQGLLHLRYDIQSRKTPRYAWYSEQENIRSGRAMDMAVSRTSPLRARFRAPKQ